MKKRFGIFWGVSGVLVCLLLGIALYRRSMSAPEISMAAIPTENLQISENQNAYPSSNFGVSILGTEEFDVREEIEFSVENNSGQDWFWEPNIEVGRILLKDEEHKSKETGLTIKFGDIWYDVPFRNNPDEIAIPAIAMPLSSEKETTVAVWKNLYPDLCPGTYRFTIVVYNHNGDGFYLTKEFSLIEE